MAFNGSGVYALPSTTVTPAVNGTTIESTEFNTFTADLASALTNVICKDGQTTVTADLPMATYKHTGVGNGSARNHYTALGQLQDGGAVYGVAGGTADAQTLTLSPPITAYSAGQTFTFAPAADNTGAAFTLNVNGLGAKSVLTMRGSNPAANTIDSAGVAQVVYAGSHFVMVSNEVTANGTETLTKKSLSSPVIDAVFDPNGNVQVDYVPVASAVNYLQFYNNSTGNDATIGAASSVDTDVNINLLPKGSGIVAINSIPVYGMVILDTPQELVHITSTSDTNWTTFDMSAAGGSAATAATAGATKAILHIVCSADITATTSATLCSIILDIAKSGQSGPVALGEYTKSYSVGRKNTTAAAENTNCRDATETTVNLDSNSDFQYGTNLSGTLANHNTWIYLVGYYV